MIRVLSSPYWPPSGLPDWPGPIVVLGALIHSMSYLSEKKQQTSKEIILPL